MRTWLLIALTVLLPALQLSFARAEELSLRVGEDDIDLVGRSLHFELGTSARLAELEVFSPDGELLHSGREFYDDPPPGTRLEIGWPDLGSHSESFRLELKVTDSKDRWVTFQVIRFYLEVPHEEVEFESGKSEIPKPQEAKLQKPLELLKDAAAKYAKLMDVSLYVAGHTDTVGKAPDNQALSERRAQAIADYFIAHGLTQMPIFVRGFGEGALAVKTADSVPEAKNRRAMYIVSSFVPVLQGPGEFKKIR